MNVFEKYLGDQFPEVKPRDFYRMIFPVGSFETKGMVGRTGVYNGVAVSISSGEKKDGKPKVKRYVVTDDLDVIDGLCRTDDFCIMSPLSYAGAKRTAENARYCYGIAVDLDHIQVDGDDPVGLRNLWGQVMHLGAYRVPRPTFIVSSGTGVHLYYVLTDPVALFADQAKVLQALKHDLTDLAWNMHVVDIKDRRDVQQEGIYQGFRMPGTITKTGGRARAFRTGDRIEIEQLQDAVEDIAGLRVSREKKERPRFYKLGHLTIEKAKEIYPEWYNRRIVKGEPRGIWHVSRNVYEWWKRQITSGATVGHRYYCLMMLAVYAQKCAYYDPKHNPHPVTYEELENDAFSFLQPFDEKTTDEHNHFISADVLDALEAYNERWVTYPRNSIEYKTGIAIPANRRNGRKQDLHLKGARALQKINDEANGTDWRSGNGRHSKGPVVRQWRRENPSGRKVDCIRETGLSKPTVYKYWNI